MSFQSILNRVTEGLYLYEQPTYFHDLNLNQIVDTIVEGKKEYNLKPYFYTPLYDRDTVHYRLEVMKDLENIDLLSSIKTFARNMQTIRDYLRRYEKLHYYYQKEYYFLEAVRTYCEALQSLSAELLRQSLNSEGFWGFRDYLGEYTSSKEFIALFEEAKSIITKLNSIKYNMIIKGGCITVYNYEGENNYRIEIEKTFEKFQQGSVKNFLREYQMGYDMNHVEAAVLDNVVKLNPEIFQVMDNFCKNHSDFLSKVVLTFDREIQFYVSFIDYMARFKLYGLSFCYPTIGDSKEIYNYGGFDLALANNLIKSSQQVICNDFYLKDQERIFIVTGPNQGGKTTFARTFGQLYYLASLGCMVPGTGAQLILPDKIFCHFEKEETEIAHSGKLKDDLIRIHDILKEATPNSIIIINEIFSSATLKDAIYLGEKIIDKIIAADLLCVCVTFIDELATYSHKIVSMSSTVLDEEPSARTYKIIRKSADGLAFAISIAEKYRLTYDGLKERIQL